jgi:energy-coupling factor transporter ATP-binding protein EcfA2
VKITNISVQNFRAFDEPFELDLDGGKNLLFHGENGSGKSSIYFALKRFFEERGDDITKHRNHFAPDTRTPHVRVHIKGKDAMGNDHDDEFHWDVADGHPLPVPKDQNKASIPETLRSLLVDGARRTGFLDYRMMLRTHLLSNPLSRSNRGPKIHDIIYGAEYKGLEAQLFDLVSLMILAGVRVTISGGAETTIGTLVRRVWENRPATRRKKAMDRANSAANAFNQAFNAKLPELETKLAEFLNYFENHELSIKFQPVALAWDKPTLELMGAELIPQITFRGKEVADHHQFLNEARLSALATCLFLAGVFLCDNDYANSGYPRFLVLDDALIGLELQNRLPVLRILTSDAFKNYQIFLLTFDRVWFDLARRHLREKDGWLHRELIADEDTGHLIPRQRSSELDLERAKKHLANGDLKAAAVYARSAFESKLRNVCEKNGIKISFKTDADKISAGVLWDGIILRQREREEQKAKGSQVSDFVSVALESAVDTMRSTVLNKLSHAGASGLVQSEVANAIATVENVFAHPFPKSS